MNESPKHPYLDVELEVAIYDKSGLCLSQEISKNMEVFCMFNDKEYKIRLVQGSWVLFLDQILSATTKQNHSDQDSGIRKIKNLLDS
jgi:hypothetical protein